MFDKDSEPYIAGGPSMSNVFELEDKREVWLACEILCVACSHKWGGVVHQDRQTKLECPECKELKGAVIQQYISNP